MKKLLLVLAGLIASIAPAYASAEKGHGVPVKHEVRESAQSFYLELHNELTPIDGYSFVDRRGRRITVESLRSYPTPHDHERWVSLDGGKPVLAVVAPSFPDTSNMVAEGSTGGGSFLGFATAYGACADLGGGLCLTTAGALQIADPVAALVVTSLTPTTIAGNASFSGTPVFSTTPSGGNGAMSAQFSGVAQLTQGVAATVASNVSAGTSVVITPNSTAGMFVGQALLFDTNTTNVESVVVTVVGATTITVQSVANAHTCPCTLKAGPSFNMTQAGPGGGYQFTVPNGYQGSVNDPAGIIETVVPIETSGATNVPYDIALLGSQQGQTAKAQHQIYVSSSSTTEDDLMMLFGPSSQLNLTSSAPKCLTLNTGTGGTTTTPSIFIFKCNGDFTAFGNISANSTSNGTGELGTGGAGVVSGANAIGDIHVGGGTITSVTNGNCSGAGNPCGGHVDQNIYFNDNAQNAAQQTCTAPFACEFTGSVTTTPTSYKLTFLQSFVQKPICWFFDYTHPADVPTAVAFTGSSPYTAVTFTVTTSLADDAVIDCFEGNGP